MRDKIGKDSLRYNPEAFSAKNIYDSKKFWNNNIVKKPTLLDLEKYYKLAIEREEREDVATCWKELKKKRNKLLEETDWTQYADVPIVKQTRSRYRDYRKYLRDAPSRYDNKSIVSFKIEEYGEWLLRIHPEDFDA